LKEKRNLDKVKLFITPLPILFMLLIPVLGLYSQGQSIIARKKAKVGNEIILLKEVEKQAKLYGISNDDALNGLIEDSILYQGAKIYVSPPGEGDIDNRITDDKIFYASRANKNLKDVTDTEFLQALMINNVSMKTYKEYVKRKLWIDIFIIVSMEKERLKKYTPTNEEIEKYIKDNHEIFEEKSGIVLSMIYFSYYTTDGKLKSTDIIKQLKPKSEQCLDELINGADFGAQVSIYSDDLFSIKATPKGRVGVINIDDPRINQVFSPEIANIFKTKKIGIIHKVFETKNGLYIFKIDDTVEPVKLSEIEMRIKAESLLIKDYEMDLKSRTKEKLIKELKENIDIVIYE